MKIKTPWVEPVILKEWCEQHCQGEYRIGFWDCYFDLESDAVLFKLRFPE